jgi:hypothetical protein
MRCRSDGRARTPDTSLIAATLAVVVGAMIVLSSVSCGAGEPAASAPSEEGKEMDVQAPRLAGELLICLWQHRQEVDIAPIVKELGFNTVWTDDDPYDGQAWEETHMYRALQAPGIKYVIPKVDRAAWGWTQEIALRHAKWVARLSLEHKEIIALYLNDFYDEIEDGHRTMEQWSEIIAAVKAVNPDLKLIVPHYPHRRNVERPYDFDHDAVIFNLWHHRDISRVEEHLTQAERQHADKPLFTGLYLNSGSGRGGGHWLTEEEFKGMLRLFVDHANAGKTAGVRIFCAYQLEQRPEYIEWAKEVLTGLSAPDEE